MANTLREMFERHELSATEFATWMDWSRFTCARKLSGDRSWTSDEIESAASWLRAHGVPVVDRDVAQLIRRAVKARKEEGRQAS